MTPFLHSHSPNSISMNSLLALILILSNDLSNSLHSLILIFALQVHNRVCNMSGHASKLTGSLADGLSGNLASGSSALNLSTSGPTLPSLAPQANKVLHSRKPLDAVKGQARVTKHTAREGQDANMTTHARGRVPQPVVVELPFDSTQCTVM